MVIKDGMFNLDMPKEYDQMLGKQYAIVPDAGRRHL